MPKFEVKEIEFPLPTRQKFYQLTVETNDNKTRTGVLELFEMELEKKYRKDMDMIYAYMNMVANGAQIPGTKYHILERDKNDPYPDFEFKHGKIRVYGIKIHSGKVIFFGSYKTQERKNIQRLRSLKQQYFEENK